MLSKSPNTLLLYLFSGFFFVLAQSCADVQNENIAPGHEVKSDKQRVVAPDIPAGDLEQLVSGNTAFALDMYHALVEGAENDEVFFSPYSISLALAMTWAGARNDTEDQMASTLHFDLGQDRLHPAFNFLDLALMSRGEGAEGQDGDGFRLNVVNSIWGQDGYEFLDTFLDVLAENYGAGLRLLDFVADPDSCAEIINKWVEQYTEERIKNLIPPGTISPLTRLVLVNAIYFNAAWANSFEEEDTDTGQFHTLSGDTIDVAMMHQVYEMNYGEGDGFKALEILYDGDELSMVLLLPDQGRFTEVEQALSPEMVDGILSSMDIAQVTVSLPKWKYTSESIRLREILSQMGMPIAFSDSADFSGMDGKIYLHISNVVHKAFISVNEAGTEAAAATAVIMEGNAAPPVPKTFDANRPFIYFIRDIQTGSILFMGRVTAPVAE